MHAVLRGICLHWLLLLQARKWLTKNAGGVDVEALLVKAAELLNVSKSLLQYKLKKYTISAK